MTNGIGGLSQQQIQQTMPWLRSVLQPQFPPPMQQVERYQTPQNMPYQQSQAPSSNPFSSRGNDWVNQMMQQQPPALQSPFMGTQARVESPSVVAERLAAMYAAANPPPPPPVQQAPAPFTSTHVESSEGAWSPLPVTSYTPPPPPTHVESSEGAWSPLPAPLPSPYSAPAPNAPSPASYQMSALTAHLPSPYTVAPPAPQPQMFDSQGGTVIPTQAATNLSHVESSEGAWSPAPVVYSPPAPAPAPAPVNYQMSALTAHLPAPVAYSPPPLFDSQGGTVIPTYAAMNPNVAPQWDGGARAGGLVSLYRNR